MNLSEHFTLEELTHSDAASRLGLDNTPIPAVVENLKRLAAFLEDVREYLGGRVIMVNSAYRSPAVNAAIGGKKTSQHLLGLAADIRVQGMKPAEVVNALMKSGLEYDQLILEFNSWTHISIPALDQKPRKQALIIDSSGVRHA